MYVDAELLAVVVYRKGARAIADIRLVFVVLELELYGV